MKHWHSSYLRDDVTSLEWRNCCWRSIDHFANRRAVETEFGSDTKKPTFRINASFNLFAIQEELPVATERLNRRMVIIIDLFRHPTMNPNDLSLQIKQWPT